MASGECSSLAAERAATGVASVSDSYLRPDDFLIGYQVPPQPLPAIVREHLAVQLHQPDAMLRQHHPPPFVIPPPLFAARAAI